MNTRYQIGSLLLIALLSVILGGIYSSISYWTLAVSGGTTVLAVFCGLLELSRRLWQLLCIVQETRIRLDRSAHNAGVNSAVEMHAMSSVMQRFPQCAIPTSSWSMRFANLNSIIAILDEVVPNSIVELGSGISTICMAAWLRERGTGKLISYDHDPNWAAITCRYLSKYGLDKFAEVHVAPLRARKAFGHTVEWYDICDLDSLPPVDILIVDGPPAGTPEIQLSRIAALDVLHPYLSPAATVILDDAHREGEQWVISKWSQAHPEFSVRIVNTFSGQAVLKRGAGTACRSGADTCAKL